MRLTRSFFYLFLISIPFGSRILLHQFTTGFNEYEAVFLYASDILMILFIIFAFGRRGTFEQIRFSQKFLKPLLNPISIFIFLAAVSVFFAFSKWLAIYDFFRLGLLILMAFGMAKILKDGIVKLENILAVIAGSAIFQALIGIAQFFKQASLGLGFLGEPVLGANVGGAAKIVVEGAKILRAYGTFPHPNVLAAFLILGLLSFYYLFLKIPNPKSQIPNKLQFSKFQTFRNLFGAWYLVLGIFSVSLGLLFAFSRTAWLLAAIITAVLILYSLFRKVNFRQAVRLGILMLAIGAILFFGFRSYILTRAQVVATEPSVSYRLEYNKLALDLIKKNPFGVGIGNQVLYSVKNGIYQKFGMAQAWQWQPIHNIYLLIASEIGVLGLLAFLMFLGRLIIHNSSFLIPTIMLITLLLFGLVDHFLWTLQPGRLMLWLAVGLLIGIKNKSGSRIDLM